MILLRQNSRVHERYGQRSGLSHLVLRLDLSGGGDNLHGHIVWDKTLRAAAVILKERPILWDVCEGV
jgi:hypothetical protein